jgi:hypothetical protein
MLMARDGTTYVSGFSPDGTSLTTWSADSPHGGDAVATLSWPDEEAQAESFESDDGRISMVFPTETSALVMTTNQAGAGMGPASWKHLDFKSGDWTDLPELDGFQWDRGYPESAWMVLNEGVGPGSSTIIVDRASGEIAARLDDPDLGMSTGRSPARDLSALAITGHTGEAETTGYVLDATSGESWAITPPEIDGDVPPGIFYSISPDGALLVATSHDPQGGDVETWVSPVQPEPEWTSIGPRSIETWLYFPDDGS